jgi:hypothetical protein
MRWLTTRYEAGVRRLRACNALASPADGFGKECVAVLAGRYLELLTQHRSDVPVWAWANCWPVVPRPSGPVQPRAAWANTPAGIAPGGRVLRR